MYVQKAGYGCEWVCAGVGEGWMVIGMSGHMQECVFVWQSRNVHLRLEHKSPSLGEASPCSTG